MHQFALLSFPTKIFWICYYCTFCIRSLSRLITHFQENIFLYRHSCIFGNYDVTLCCRSTDHFFLLIFPQTLGFISLHYVHNIHLPNTK